MNDPGNPFYSFLTISGLPVPILVGWFTSDRDRDGGTEAVFVTL
jgi:hypothetical protein